MTYSLVQDNIRNNARIQSNTKHEGKKVYALHKPNSYLGMATISEKLVNSYTKDGFKVIGVFLNGEEQPEKAIKLIPKHWYKFDDRGEIHVGYYYGRQRGFECCVCGKGEYCHCFNIWYVSDGGKHVDYETWGYGASHLPKIIEDLGEHDGILKDNQDD